MAVYAYTFRYFGNCIEFAGIWSFCGNFVVSRYLVSNFFGKAKA